MGFNDLTDTAMRIILSSAAFGDDFTHRPASGSSQTIKGLFSDDFEEVDIDGNVMIDSNTPNLGVNLNEFNTAPEQGDTIIIGPQEYGIVSVQEDGHGGATIFLHEA